MGYLPERVYEKLSPASASVTVKGPAATVPTATSSLTLPVNVPVMTGVSSLTSTMFTLMVAVLVSVGSLVTALNNYLTFNSSTCIKKEKL